jgi:hypothetical protein
LYRHSYDIVVFVAIFAAILFCSISVLFFFSIYVAPWFMLLHLVFFSHLNQKTFHSSLDQRGIFPLLRQLQHDVRNLNILLRLVLGGNFEDDVLLVGGDGLLADGLDESGHPVGEVFVSMLFRDQSCRILDRLTSWEDGPCSSMQGRTKHTAS